MILDSTPNTPAPINSNTGNAARLIHTDHLNTPRTITSATGAILWTWQGDPFGNSQPSQAAITPTISNARIGATAQGYTYNQRFAGQTYDKETGLYYNYFRHYDPQTGRYVEADPIGLEGGWNRYAYVGGMPTRVVDPRGLDTLILSGAQTSGNPFGHVALAFSDSGVYSYGTGTPLGGSLAAYLNKQSSYRNTSIYRIGTTKEQEDAMKRYLKTLEKKGLPSVPSIDSNDTCATRSNEALKLAGMEDPQLLLSSWLFGNVSNMPKSTSRIGMEYGDLVLQLPVGGALPAWLGGFEPK